MHECQDALLPVLVYTFLFCEHARCLRCYLSDTKDLYLLAWDKVVLLTMQAQPNEAQQSVIYLIFDPVGSGDAAGVDFSCSHWTAGHSRCRGL